MFIIRNYFRMLKLSLWRHIPRVQCRNYFRGNLENINQDVEKIAEVIDQSQNIVVMAGAGLSTASGIPDFRSPSTGIYANLQKYNLPYPEAIFEIDYFRYKILSLS